MLRLEAFPSLLCLIVPGNMGWCGMWRKHLRLLFASTVTVVEYSGPLFSSTQTSTQSVEARVPLEALSMLSPCSLFVSAGPVADV